MSVELEVQKIMNKNKTQKRIMRMAKKNDVSYDTAKTLYELTLIGILKDKEFWNRIEVRPT